jgi:hypothetical protein
MFARLALLALAAVATGCAGPQLYFHDLRVDSFDGTTLRYTVTILLRDTNGPALCWPQAITEPIILQSWSGPNPDVTGGIRAQGGSTILQAGAVLNPGQTITVTRTTVAPLVPGQDVYLIPQVYVYRADPTPRRCERIGVQRAVLVPYR